MVFDNIAYIEFVLVVGWFAKSFLSQLHRGFFFFLKFMFLEERKPMPLLVALQVFCSSSSLLFSYEGYSAFAFFWLASTCEKLIYLNET